MEVVGIDDAEHYRANVEAYRQSAKRAEKYKADLAQTKRALQEKKLSTFNPELAVFDAKVEAYRAGKISMGEFAKAVIARSEATKQSQTKEFRKSSAEIASATRRPRNDNLSRFVEALNLERSLDFPRVESERTRLLERLLPKLNKAQSQELVQVATAYRLGNIAHTEFYDYIQSLCLKNGVDLKSFPAMNDYIHYVLLSESIDGDKLFEEMKQLEEAAYQTLAKTEEEKAWVAESKRVYLTGKLLDFALTNEEWQEYRLSSLIPSAPYKSFENFYKEAEIRDQLMAENFLKGVMRNEQWEIRSHYSSPITHNVFVLVTGGFHSTGIDKLLTQAGCTVVTFVPKITRVDSENGSTYLSMFTQEKTPLEKLFEGQKLFLAMDPISPTAALGAAVQATTMEVAAGTKDAPAAHTWFSKFTGWKIRFGETKNGLIDLFATAKFNFKIVLNLKKAVPVIKSATRIVPIQALILTSFTAGVFIYFKVSLAWLAPLFFIYWGIFRLLAKRVPSRTGTKSKSLVRHALIPEFQPAIDLFVPSPPENGSRWQWVRYFLTTPVASIQAGDMAICRSAVGRFPHWVQRLILRHLKNRLWYQVTFHRRPLIHRPGAGVWDDPWFRFIETTVVLLMDICPIPLAADVPKAMMMEARRLRSPKWILIRIKENLADPKLKTQIAENLNIPSDELTFDKLRQEFSPRTTWLKKAKGLSRKTGKEVLVKMESKHQVGSFKARVVVQILRWFVMMTPAERRAVSEILVESTGNQGRAVGRAVKLLKVLFPEDTKNLKAVVFTSRNVPANKRLKMERESMEIRAEFDNYDHAHQAVKNYRAEMTKQGKRVLHVQHGSPWVLAGYTTMGLEILEQLKKRGLDKKQVAVAVPTGSGGLASGLVLAFRAMGRKDIKVVPVQTDNLNAMDVSLRRQEPVAILFPEQAAADGIAATPEWLPYIIFRWLFSTPGRLVVVDEQQAMAGTAHLLHDLNNLSMDNGQPVSPLAIKRKVEVSSGLGVAALLNDKQGHFKDAEVVVVIDTGRNIEPELLTEVMATTSSAFRVDKGTGSQGDTPPPATSVAIARKFFDSRVPQILAAFITEAPIILLAIVFPPLSYKIWMKLHATVLLWINGQIEEIDLNNPFQLEKHNIDRDAVKRRLRQYWWTFVSLLAGSLLIPFLSPALWWTPIVGLLAPHGINNVLWLLDKKHHKPAATAKLQIDNPAVTDRIREMQEFTGAARGEKPSEVQREKRSGSSDQVNEEATSALTPKTNFLTVLGEQLKLVPLTREWALAEPEKFVGLMKMIEGDLQINGPQDLLGFFNDPTEFDPNLSLVVIDPENNPIALAICGRSMKAPKKLHLSKFVVSEKFQRSIVASWLLIRAFAPAHTSGYREALWGTVLNPDPSIPGAQNAPFFYDAIGAMRTSKSSHDLFGGTKQVQFQWYEVSLTKALANLSKIFERKLRAPTEPRPSNDELIAIATQIVSLVREGSIRALAEAENLRFMLLARLGILPKPEEGHVISILNGGNPFPFQYSQGTGVDRRREKAWNPEAVKLALENNGHVLNLDVVNKNYKGTIICDFQDTASLRNQITGMNLIPTAFLLQHAEDYFVTRLVHSERVFEEESKRQFEKALRGLITNVSPPAGVFIVIDNPDYTDTLMTGRILEEYGYKDILPVLLPPEALDQLEQASHRIDAIQVHDTLQLPLGGRMRVFVKDVKSQGLTPSLLQGYTLPPGAWGMWAHPHLNLNKILGLKWIGNLEGWILLGSFAGLLIKFMPQGPPALTPDCVLLFSSVALLILLSLTVLNFLIHLLTGTLDSNANLNQPKPRGERITNAIGSTITASSSYIGVPLIIAGMFVGPVLFWILMVAGLGLGGWIHGVKNGNTMTADALVGSLWRAYHHSMFSPWEGENVYRYPLTVTDHRILTALSFIPIAIIIIANLLLILSPDKDPNNWISWGIQLAGLPVALLGCCYVARTHYIESAVAALVAHNARRYLQNPDQIFNSNIQSIAERFEEDTGWKIIWIKDSTILAQLDPVQQHVNMSIGWALENGNPKHALRIRAYLRHVLKAISVAIADKEQSKQPELTSDSPTAESQLSDHEKEVKDEIFEKVRGTKDDRELRDYLETTLLQSSRERGPEYAFNVLKTIFSIDFYELVRDKALEFKATYLLYNVFPSIRSKYLTNRSFNQEEYTFWSKLIEDHKVEIIAMIADTTIKILKHPDLLIRAEGLSLWPLDQGTKDDPYGLLPGLVSNTQVQDLVFRNFDSAYEGNERCFVQDFRSLLTYMIPINQPVPPTYQAKIKTWAPRIVQRMKESNVVIYYLHKGYFPSNFLSRIIEMNPHDFNDVELLNKLVSYVEKNKEGETWFGDDGSFDPWYTIQIIAEASAAAGLLFPESIYSRLKSHEQGIRTYLKDWLYRDLSPEKVDRVDRLIAQIQNAPSPGAWGVWAYLRLNNFLGLNWIGNIESWMLLGSFAALLTKFMPQGPPAFTPDYVLLFSSTALLILLGLTVINFLVHYFTGSLDSNAELNQPKTFGERISNAAKSTLTASWSYLGVLFIVPAMFFDGWFFWGLLLAGTGLGGWVHGMSNINSGTNSRAIGTTFPVVVYFPILNFPLRNPKNRSNWLRMLRPMSPATRRLSGGRFTQPTSTFSNSNPKNLIFGARTTGTSSIPLAVIISSLLSGVDGSSPIARAVSSGIVVTLAPVSSAIRRVRVFIAPSIRILTRTMWFFLSIWRGKKDSSERERITFRQPIFGMVNQNQAFRSNGLLIDDVTIDVVSQQNASEGSRGFLVVLRNAYQKPLRFAFEAFADVVNRLHVFGSIHNVSPLRLYSFLRRGDLPTESNKRLGRLQGVGIMLAAPGFGALMMSAMNPQGEGISPLQRPSSVSPSEPVPQTLSRLIDLKWGVDRKWLDENRSRIVLIFISGGESPGVNDYFGYGAHELRKQGLIPVAVQNGTQGFVGQELEKRLLVIDEEVEKKFLGMGGCLAGTSRINLLSPNMSQQLSQVLENMSGFHAHLAIGGGDHATFWTKFSNEIRLNGKIPDELKKAADDVLSRMIVVYKTIDGDTWGQPLGFYTATRKAQETIYAAAASGDAMKKVTVVGIMGAEVGRLAVKAASRYPPNLEYLKTSPRQEDQALARQIETYRNRILILIPEAPHSLQEIVAAARQIQLERGSVTLVVSEGFGISEADPLLHQLTDPQSTFYDPDASEAWQKALRAPRDPHGNIKRAEIPIETIIASALKHFICPGKTESVRSAEKIGYGTMRGANPTHYDRLYPRLMARRVSELIRKKNFGVVVDIPPDDASIDEAFIRHFQRPAPIEWFHRLLQFLFDLVRLRRFHFPTLEDRVFEEVKRAKPVRIQSFEAVDQLRKRAGLYDALQSETLEQLRDAGVLISEARGAWGLWKRLHLNNILGLNRIGNIEGWILLGSFAALLTKFMPQGPPALTPDCVLLFSSVALLILLSLTVLNFLIHLLTGTLDSNADLNQPETRVERITNAIGSTITASSSYVGVPLIVGAMFAGPVLFWILIAASLGLGGWVHGMKNESATLEWGTLKIPNPLYIPGLALSGGGSLQGRPVISIPWPHIFMMMEAAPQPTVFDLPSYADDDDFLDRYKMENFREAKRGRLSTREAIEIETRAALFALAWIVRLRRWMDEKGAQRKPLVLWQNLSLGEWYPPLSDAMKKELGIVEVSKDDVSNLADPAVPLPLHIQHARFVLIKLRKSSTTPVMDASAATILQQIYKRLDTTVVMLDHSKERYSVAQLTTQFDLQVHTRIPWNMINVKEKESDLNRLIESSPLGARFVFLNPNPGIGSVFSSSFFDDTPPSFDQEVRIAGQVTTPRKAVWDWHVKAVEAAWRQDLTPSPGRTGIEVEPAREFTIEIALKFSEKVRYTSALGKPGAGKGTVLSRFVRELNSFLPPDKQYVVLTMGDIFRGAGKEGLFKNTKLPAAALEAMGAGKLISDETTLEILNDVLKLDHFRNAHGIFFDGFPRSMEQLSAARQGRVLINGKPLHLDYNFVLDIDNDTIRERARNRRAEAINKGEAPRKDDQPEKVEARIREYDDLTKPAVDAKRGQPDTIALNGEEAIDTVYEKFIGRLDVFLDAQTHFTHQIKILIADKFENPETLTRINELANKYGGRVEILGDYAIKKARLAEVLRDNKPTIIIVRSDTKVFHPKQEKGGDPTFWELANGVKAIVRAGAGVDNIDTKKAAEIGMAVLRTHGNANSVANLTLRFIIAGLRKRRAAQGFPTRTYPSTDVADDPIWKKVFDVPIEQFRAPLEEAVKKGRAGQFTLNEISAFFDPVFQPLSSIEAADLFMELGDKTIGLAGFGAIPRLVVEKLNKIRFEILKEAKFKIAATSRTLDKADPESEDVKLATTLRVEFPGKASVIKNSAVLSIHVPGEAKGYLTADDMAGSKAEVLINTAREDGIRPEVFKGENGKLPFVFYGDLDVTDSLFDLKNNFPDHVHLIPHIGASTKDAADGVETNTLLTLQTLIERALLLLVLATGLVLIPGCSANGTNSSWMVTIAMLAVSLFILLSDKTGFPGDPGGARVTEPNLQPIAEAYVNTLREGRVAPSDVAELWPVGSVGVDGNGTLTNLNFEERDALIHLIKQGLSKQERKTLTFEQARNAALKLEGYKFTSLKQLVNDSHLLLDVKIQDEGDVEKALPIITSVLKAIPNDTPVFIPIKATMVNSFMATFDFEQSARIMFVHSENGFYADGVFDLESALGKLGGATGVCVGLRGDYKASIEVLRSYQVKLVALDKILEGALGTFVPVDISEKIRAFTRALIAA